MASDNDLIDKSDPSETFNTLVEVHSPENWKLDSSQQKPVTALSQSLLDATIERQEELKEKFQFNRQEAEILSLKEQGLTVNAIAFALAYSQYHSRITPDDPQSAIDYVTDHFEQARENYANAPSTNQHLEMLFRDTTKPRDQQANRK
ncbi:MAG: hypothetical protein ABEI76_00980 [Halobacteriales archaeon]